MEANEPEESAVNKPVFRSRKKEARHLFRQKCKDYWNEWLSFSTMHGVQNIHRSDSKIIIILWVISLLISLATCGYLITGIILNYFSYNVLILINVVSESPIEFPAVTICNLNFLDRRTANNFIDQTLVKNDLSYVRQVASMNITPQAVANLLRASAISDLSEDERKNYSFPLDYMYLTCSYNNVPCKAEEDFIRTYDYYYGNCYTFNSGLYPNGSQAPIRKISEAGSDKSFRMDIFLGDDKYQNEFISNSGARIVIHNQSVTPLISSEGFDISTGYQTNIGIKRSFLYKLDEPYSDCIKKADSPDSHSSQFYKAVFNKLNMTTYRKENCLKLCLQAYIKDACKCIDGSLPNIYGQFKVCATLKDLDCASNARVAYYDDPVLSKCKDCPLECDSVNYQLSSSNSRYPSLYYLDYLKATTDISYRITLNNASSPSENQVIKSAVLLNVFYDDLSTTYINEVPSITSDSLLGIIGGNIGLFTGVSLLSVVEIFELLTQLCINYVIYVKNR